MKKDLNLRNLIRVAFTDGFRSEEESLSRGTVVDVNSHCEMCFVCVDVRWEKASGWKFFLRVEKGCGKKRVSWLKTFIYRIAKKKKGRKEKKRKKGDEGERELEETREQKKRSFLLILSWSYLELSRWDMKNVEERKKKKKKKKEEKV